MDFHIDYAKLASARLPHPDLQDAFNAMMMNCAAIDCGSVVDTNVKKAEFGEPLAVNYAMTKRFSPDEAHICTGRFFPITCASAEFTSNLPAFRMTASTRLSAKHLCGAYRRRTKRGRKRFRTFIEAGMKDLKRIEISLAVADALNEESFDALPGELAEILVDLEEAERRQLLEEAWVTIVMASEPGCLPDYFSAFSMEEEPEIIH